MYNVAQKVTDSVFCAARMMFDPTVRYNNMMYHEGARMNIAASEKAEVLKINQKNDV